MSWFELNGILPPHSGVSAADGVWGRPGRSRRRQEATALRIAAAEMNAVASAFEQDDLARAKRMKTGNV